MSQQGAVVFVGGSRTITQIPALLHARLEQIVARNLAVVVGDAPGADAAVQGMRIPTSWCTTAAPAAARTWVRGRPVR